MLWYEYRPSVQRAGPPRLISAEQINNVTGFVSVYGFDEQGKRFIEENQSTRGIQGNTLYSNTLYIDIDDNDAYATEVENRLDAAELGYKMYNTGGRGFHFHIPIVPMIGRDVAYKQRCWMKHNFPLADHSLYKTTGVIRTPGTFHEKNPGKFKQLVKKHDGQVLEITLKDLPAQVTKRLHVETAEYDNEAILDDLLMTPVQSGSRNNELYKRGFFCKEVGYTLEEATNILQVFNRTFTFPPLSAQEVYNVARSVYR